MKTFKFAIDFISANNGCIVSTCKEYRAENMDQAIAGMNQYLESNRMIQHVLSSICIDEVLTVLDFLCLCYGWQGGTIYQALTELHYKSAIVRQKLFDIHRSARL